MLAERTQRVGECCCFFFQPPAQRLTTLVSHSEANPKNNWMRGEQACLVSTKVFEIITKLFLFQCIPEQDVKRKKLLRRKDVISDNDGLVSKNGKWRSSFSFSERNLIALKPELYQALKYLNKVDYRLIWSDLQIYCTCRCPRPTSTSPPTSWRRSTALISRALLHQRTPETKKRRWRCRWRGWSATLRLIQLLPRSMEPSLEERYVTHAATSSGTSSLSLRMNLRRWKKNRIVQGMCLAKDFVIQFHFQNSSNQGRRRWKKGV